MRQFIVATLLVALWSACFSSVGSASAANLHANLNDGEATEAIAAHNAIRQRVAQAESQRLGGTVAIPDLIWDADIAAVAQDWADQQAARLQQGLPTEHRPNNVYGENIYWAWSAPDQPDLTPTAAVTWWASEEAYYDYDTNTCADGQVCGHYTQVVWSTTTYIGCGQSIWADADGRQYVLWVCNYAAPGNLTINGELLHPYSITEAPEPEPGCAYAWPRTLEIGMQGEDVAELQRRLNAAGANLDIDGDFGSVTDQAVRDYQVAHDLVVDGSVGSQTQESLNQVCPQ
jgi:pathogenesis-related protein 1